MYKYMYHNTPTYTTKKWTIFKHSLLSLRYSLYYEQFFCNICEGTERYWIKHISCYLKYF